MCRRRAPVLGVIAGLPGAFARGLHDRGMTNGRVRREKVSRLALAVALVLPGCSRDRPATENHTPSGTATGVSFVPRTIGNAVVDPAWITDLTIVDLDRDGRRDVVACEGRQNQILWLRQHAPSEFAEHVIGDAVAGPAHVEAVDLDRDGDADLLVASMGLVLPSNEKSGAVVVLENLGDGRWRNRTLVEQTFRVTDVQAADLDADGDLDLAVAQFGYLEGQVQWLENVGEWRFAEHGLLPLAGTVHAPVADFNADGRPDIAALVTQDWEEVHLLENRGARVFADRVVHGSTNRDYGSSGLGAGDLDRDGDVDLAWTNGDGFDYATPGARPWHGLQWLQNNGAGRFTFHRVGDLAGAYSPVIVDLDGDGDRDLVAASGFNDWTRPAAMALAWFENDGRQNFVRRDLASAPTHLVVVDAGDLVGDARVELVTGSFAFYPPHARAGRITLWTRSP
jgi:hypothetical protein